MKLGYWLLVCNLSLAMSHVAIAANSQTYYTWADADGIIHITATPPPSNNNAQLHNVTEYKAEIKVAVAAPNADYIQTIEQPVDNSIQPQSSPAPKTPNEVYRDPFAQEKAQCKAMYSDASDVAQCIRRVKSTAGMRFNIFDGLNRTYGGYCPKKNR